MRFFRAMFMGALLMALPLVSFAITKKSLTVTNPIQIGQTVLKPGHYKIVWSGNGPQVPVKFERNNKTVATAQATVKHQQNPYNNALELGSQSGSKTQVLNQIDFKNESLAFHNAGGTSGE